MNKVFKYSLEIMLGFALWVVIERYVTTNLIGTDSNLSVPLLSMYVSASRYRIQLLRDRHATILMSIVTILLIGLAATSYFATSDLKQSIVLFLSIFAVTQWLATAPLVYRSHESFKTLIFP